MSVLVSLWAKTDMSLHHNLRRHQALAPKALPLPPRGTRALPGVLHAPCGPVPPCVLAAACRAAPSRGDAVLAVWHTHTLL